jgi:methionyl aminopeptidase
VNRLSRNDLCWCGSGKKYKQCHLKYDLVQERAAGPRARRPVSGRKSREVIIKTPEQVVGIRKACALTRGILDSLEGRIVPGITTEQINAWVHDMTTAAGAIPAPLNYRGYPKSVCTSINEVICHGIPTPERVLKEGDIINIDVTSILDGYYGDSSRMFLVGEASESARKLVKATRRAMYLGIEQVKPGNTIGDIGHAIQRFAEGQGYSVVRAFVGHGTGVQFHEAPDVPHYGEPGTGLALVPNMTFTIEPMINVGGFQATVLEDGWTAVTLDGSLSAQWEHTVRVTEDGVEMMTAPPGMTVAEALAD